MKNNLFTFLFLIFLTPTFAQNDSLISKNLTQFILVRHAEKMDNSKNPEFSETLLHYERGSEKTKLLPHC